MADNAPEQTAEQPAEQPIVINAQYTKDLSFEAPGAPLIFNKIKEQQPDISININVKTNPVQDKLYEVTLELSARCMAGEDVAFILELEYAGLFTINVPDEHLQPVLLIECPRLLFPFARNILADVSRDGGFPALMLGPVDFVAMFQAEINRSQAENGAENSVADAEPAGNA